MYFVVYYIGEKCQKNIFNKPSCIQISSLGGHYFTKKNFSYAGLFLKIHIMVDDVVVYSFFFFLKKSCDPIESTHDKFI